MAFKQIDEYCPICFFSDPSQINVVRGNKARRRNNTKNSEVPEIADKENTKRERKAFKSTPKPLQNDNKGSTSSRKLVQNNLIPFQHYLFSSLQLPLLPSTLSSSQHVAISQRSSKPFCYPSSNTSKARSHVFNTKQLCERVSILIYAYFCSAYAIRKPQTQARS